jgi:PAS domain S-box-containing protein
MARIFEFIANSGDGVFAVDRSQSIVLWNTQAASILGYTAEEVLGKKCYRIVCGRDADACMVCRRGCEAITSAERTQPAPTTNVAVKTRVGAEVWLNLSTVVMPSRRGDLSVLVHLFREVTEEHDAMAVAQELADILTKASTRPRRRSSRRDSQRLTLLELTRREREVLTLLASGLNSKVIAARLNISPRTVDNHVNNILGKLDVHSRLEAVTYSIKNGLV